MSSLDATALVSSLLAQRQTSSVLSEGDAQTQAGHAAYAAISLACMALVATLFGVRTRNLHIHNLKSMNVIRLLVVLIYVAAMILIFSLGVVAGILQPTITVCRSAIYVCLIFYVSMKILMYIFLVERAHAIRAPRVRRLHDWVWVTGLVVIFVGFGAVAIDAFMFPLYDLQQDSCHIGIPPKVSIPLLAYDCVINVALTVLFVHFLRPTLRFRLQLRQERQHAPDPTALLPRHISRTVEITTTTEAVEKRLSTSTDGKEASASATSVNSDSTFVGWAHPSVRFEERHNKRMQLLLKKSLLGAFLVLIPTIINMILLVAVHGTEHEWLCFTLCSLDVTLQVCVVHWLTTDPVGELEAMPSPVSNTIPLQHASSTTPRSMHNLHGPIQTVSQV